MANAKTLTVKKTRAAHDGYVDRSATSHTPSGYTVFDQDGTVRGTIESTMDSFGSTYMATGEWHIATVKADGTKGLDGYCKYLKDAKVRAIELIEGQDDGSIVPWTPKARS